MIPPNSNLLRLYASSTSRAVDALSITSSRNSVSMISSCSRYGDRHRRGGASTACLSPTKQLDAYGHCLAAWLSSLVSRPKPNTSSRFTALEYRGEQLAPARAAFEERGYTAHTPTLRYHELPMQEGAMRVASLSLRDYTDDLLAFVSSLDSSSLWSPL